MRNLLSFLIVISILTITMGCSDLDEDKEVIVDNENEVEEEKVEKDEKKSKTPFSNDYFLKSDLKTNFETDIADAEHKISDEDYEKYNDIMDYLNDHFDRSEEELLKELESVYGQSSEELSDFMTATAEDAIARDFGKTENDISLTESDIQENIKGFFTENVKDADLLDIEVADIDILNMRSLSKGTISYGGYEFNYIIKSEYTSDFQEVDVFQLKINSKNIDLD